jgi:hypothetical protein
MRIEIDVNKNQLVELKSAMSLKHLFVSSGFSEAVIEDVICMKVLREARKHEEADAVAEQIIDGCNEVVT